MNRRMLSLLTCAVLLAAPVLPAAAREKTVIRYWAHQNEGWNLSHLDIVNRFNASQDRIEVKAEFFPYDDFEAKTQTSLISKGGAADIYEIWGGWAADFAPTGALAEVSDELAEMIRTDCLPPTYGTLTYEGKYYGVPLEFNIESGGLLVNRKQFVERGLAYPETWEEMIRIAQETSVWDGAVMDMKGLDFVSWDTVMFTWISMILSTGGQYMTEDGAFSFTSPQAVHAMEELVGYVTEKHLTNTDTLTGGGDSEGHYNLAEDRAMMVVRGPWVLSELQEIYGLEAGADIDYIPMPWYGDRPAFAAETGWGLAVSSASKNPEAAWEFVRFMTSEENMVPHLIACGMLPARTSLLDSEAYREAMPHISFLLDILPFGRYLGYFNTDVFKEAINNMFVDLCSQGGTGNVAEALAELEAQLNADLLGR